MSEELKPCPFCLRSASIIRTDGGIQLIGSERYAVQCVDCYASTGDYMGPMGYQKACDAWNKRGEGGEE